MKTTINKPITKQSNGKYSSIEDIVNAKLERASKTLKNVNLDKFTSKLNSKAEQF